MGGGRGRIKAKWGVRGEAERGGEGEGEGADRGELGWGEGGHTKPNFWGGGEGRRD